MTEAEHSAPAAPSVSGIKTAQGAGQSSQPSSATSTQTASAANKKRGRAKSSPHHRPAASKPLAEKIQALEIALDPTREDDYSAGGRVWPD